ncbi:hypothetical protein BCY86_06665 [Pajaroellobacter abortibovis]|uniref:Uncharacterized protein n=1 Tax=Pajaroellobacter abortibovis TaxID=1882918 RepID=A0A1L6MYB4_9BACT|nr:hypothetical protein BCY86_06665 [Pajaroellobacter abortibovis]
MTPKDFSWSAQKVKLLLKQTHNLISLKLEKLKCTAESDLDGFPTLKSSSELTLAGSSWITRKVKLLFNAIPAVTSL